MDRGLASLAMKPQGIAAVRAHCSTAAVGEGWGVDHKRGRSRCDVVFIALDQAEPSFSSSVKKLIAERARWEQQLEEAQSQLGSLGSWR